MLLSAVLDSVQCCAVLLYASFPEHCSYHPTLNILYSDLKYIYICYVA